MENIMGNDHSLTKGISGLTGVMMNAMVLIAPGAFLWMTFKIQLLYDVSISGLGMLFGILYALLLCFATTNFY
jgi:basic amino acid/polyamine antiporter, APA family